jgi:hypothetical protein
LNSTFYLYASREAAQNGSEFGGTGFLVGIPSEKFPQSRAGISIYGLTNRHLAIDTGFSVIRINRSDGGVDIFEFDNSEWTSHPDGSDIAVSPELNLSDPAHGALTAIYPTAFATKNIIAEHNIGVGEDVFMIGRFIDHDGGPTNSPAARFGNISLMPSKIEHKGKYIESYCIDMHSRSGYSGSPVFVYRTPGSDLNDAFNGAGNFNLNITFLFLLGIHWGQFPEEWEIVDGIKKKEESKQMEFVKGKYVKGTSGMTIISPAWHILDILNTEKFRKERMKKDDELSNILSTNSGPIEESANQDINPSHREDFNNLLDEAVKGKPSDD